MIDDTPRALAALLAREREALLGNWQQQVRRLPSARTLDAPTLEDHMPEFVDDLAAALEAGAQRAVPDAVNSGKPSAHGLQRVEDGFDIEEVVAEYGALRGCIHDLAEQHGLGVRGSSFHILNRVLDGAISMAVQTYASHRAQEVQKRREEYLAFVAHDLRTPLNAISLAAHVLERTIPGEGADPAQMRMLNTLKRNVEHLDRLVHKVLQENPAPIEGHAVKLERRTLDLWPLVEAVLHELGPLAQRCDARLVNATPEDLAVYADAALLRKILQGLVTIAIARGAEAGVSVGAREIGVQGAECWISADGACRATTSFEAIVEGEPKELQQSDGDGPATELTMVRSFVEAHGGQLALERREHGGSTFRFQLAARDAEQAPERTPTL